jgi:hypothetical protein
MPTATVDLIVLNNALHEIPPRFFPSMFSVFNRLLNPSRGVVHIIDMESLPEDQPESIAITWKASEVEAFLAAAALPAVVTRHPKLTMVYQVQVRHQMSGVDESEMLKSLRLSLKTKLSEAVTNRQQLEADLFSDSVKLRKWIVATGTIARCAEELDIIDNQ